MEYPSLPPVVRALVALAMGVLVLAGCTSSDSATTTTTAGDLDSRLTAAEVEELQKELNEVDCFAGQVDGIFGPHTRRGVEEFQAAEGLAEDGEYGPKTKAALTAAAEEGKSVCSTAPDTKPHPSGSAPCTTEAITAAAEQVEPSFTSLNGYDCSEGFAVAEITAGGTADEVVRLKSVDGAWTEDDNCAEFPQTLQSMCNAS